jgi:hypothetical protein
VKKMGEARNIPPMGTGGLRPAKRSPSRGFNETGAANPGTPRTEEELAALARAQQSVAAVPFQPPADGFDMALAVAARDTKKFFQPTHQRRVEAYEQLKAQQSLPTTARASAPVQQRQEPADDYEIDAEFEEWKQDYLERTGQDEEGNDAPDYEFQFPESLSVALEGPDDADDDYGDAMSDGEYQELLGDWQAE